MRFVFIQKKKCVMTFRNLTLIFLIFSFAGCTEVDTKHPPKIRYGTDVCDECRMIISEEQFAAVSLDRDGNTRKFDGVGCLIFNQAKHPSPAERTWVHDYQSREWIEMDKTFFVSLETLVTPMDFGLAAFSSQEAASQFAHDQGGVLVGLADLTALVQKKVERV